jgi:hypothetical protein
MNQEISSSLEKEVNAVGSYDIVFFEEAYRAWTAGSTDAPIPPDSVQRML